MTHRLRGPVGRGFLVAALIASLVMITPPPANAVVAPADGYGFGQGHAPVFYSFADTDRELDAVAKTGASWLRVLVDWSNIESTKGQYNWGYLDNIVNSARSRGLRVLGVIAFTPVWARPQAINSLLWTVPPANAQDYADFSAQVARRYGDRVSDWEMWNEPNLPTFFGLVLDNVAARYTELLKAAYPAIKAVQPGATVVAAGLSPSPGTAKPPQFLQQMYDQGAGGFFDAAAAHPYVPPDGINGDGADSWGGNGWVDVPAMHDVMAAHGDGGKKIWMTELGASTNASGGISQQEQATQILDVLAAAAGTGYSGPAFIYSIRDVNSATDNLQDHFGALLTSDWQPKYTAGVLAR